jgi:hypothetical protein
MATLLDALTRWSVAVVSRSMIDNRDCIIVVLCYVAVLIVVQCVVV